MIPKIKNVLYTTDLSKNSAYAFGYAVNTARHHGAAIHILHVIEPFTRNEKAFIFQQLGDDKADKLTRDAKEQQRREIEKRLKKFAARELKDDQKILKQLVGIHVVIGDAATEILNKADELDCDVIIMGTHEKGAISHTFLGSVAEKVLHRIRKPIYVIPLPAGELGEAVVDI